MINPIVWQPQKPEMSQMSQFIHFVSKKYQLSFASYEDFHQWSVDCPEFFWPSLAEFFFIEFEQPATTILENADQMLEAQWFSGAKLNFAKNLLKTEGGKTALVAIDEAGRRRQLSYRQLKEEVASFAAGLKARGISAGDRVAAVLPNTLETIIAMLASASLGAIWSSCSPDFGAAAIIDRLGQIEPKLLIIADGHQYQAKNYPIEEKLKSICQEINSIQAIVLVPTIGESLSEDLSLPVILWQDFKIENQALEFCSLPFNHPLFILFSSGTTGKPKCITHGAGGTLLQHVKELGLHTDMKPEDNLFFYTTSGWMMWNWMVSTLALGARLTLFDGSPMYPEADRLLQLIEDEKITIFGTSAKYISALEKAEITPSATQSLESLRCILSTGSPLLPNNYDYVYQNLKPDVQLCSISGGTDIISCFGLGNPILPVYRGEIQCIGLGMDVDVFDEEGKSLINHCGELVCKKPFPSMPIYFWQDPGQEKYQEAYFKRFDNIWAHGDYAEITNHRGLIIYGRSDAILNPGGVRIGTAEIYRQVEKIPEVLDAAVTGQQWQGDERMVLFVKLQDGLLLDESLKNKIKNIIRNHASPKHVPAKIIAVEDIPRTMNGKVLELAIKKVIHGQAVNNMESIANPEALENFKHIDELHSE